MIKLNYHRINFTAKYDESIAIIKKHYPYKYFATFFNEENYLLTKYKDIDYPSAILESYDGNIINIINCNCGYNGGGPSNTTSILELINIPEKVSSKYINKYRAVQIYFDKNGNIIEDKIDLFGIFENGDIDLLPGQINLKYIDYCNMESRKMYFINPAAQQIFTLLQLINVCEPTKFIYFLGENNQKYIDIDIPSFRLEEKTHIKAEKHNFVIIKGMFFDVVCLLSDLNSKTIINMLAIYLNVKPPFVNKEIFGIDVMIKSSCNPYSKLNKLKCLFSLLKESNKPKEDYFETLVKKSKSDS